MATDPRFVMAAKKRKIEFLEKRVHELECAITKIWFICDRLISPRQRYAIQEEDNKIVPPVDKGGEKIVK